MTKIITADQIASLADELTNHIGGEQLRSEDEQQATGLVLDRNQRRIRLRDEIIQKISAVFQHHLPDARFADSTLGQNRVRDGNQSGVDTHGNMMDAQGNFVDAQGNKVNTPVQAPTGANATAPNPVPPISRK